MVMNRTEPKPGEETGREVEAAALVLRLAAQLMAEEIGKLHGLQPSYTFLLERAFRVPVPDTVTRAQRLAVVRDLIRDLDEGGRRVE